MLAPALLEVLSEHTFDYAWQMAGGMGSRGDRPTLAERGTLGEDQAAQPPNVRHCWVIGPYGRLPALLLAWEQRIDGWHGRVVHPVEEADGWVVVEEWLPADRLEGS